MSCIFGNISNGVLNMHLLIKDVSEFIYLSVNGAAILLFVAVGVQVITCTIGSRQYYVVDWFSGSLEGCKQCNLINSREREMLIKD